MLAMTLNMAAYTHRDRRRRPRCRAERARRRRRWRSACGRARCSSRSCCRRRCKVIFPALTSQIVIMMLESAVVSQIAVRELTYEADMLQARTFRAFETYFVVTLVYLALSIGLAPPAGRRRAPRLSGLACHDRVHLLGHRAQPAARRPLDGAAVARRLRRRRRRRPGRSCSCASPSDKWRAALRQRLHRACSRARRC